MMRLLRLGAIPGLVAFLALALGPQLIGFAQATPTTQNKARIAVRVFPDLAGKESTGGTCPGCDGQFTAEDTAANAKDPLDVVDVVLLDATGKEVDHNTTSGLANGRQVTFFSVPAPADYAVDILGLKGGWAICPRGTLRKSVAASDFDETTDIATVDFYVWRGCPATKTAGAVQPTAALTGTGTTAVLARTTVTATAAVLAATATPTATLAVSATATVSATAVVSATQTVSPTVQPRASATSVATATLGVIRGVVYLDANGDGRLEMGEAGVPGAGVQLVGLGESRKTLTAGAGTYAFGELAAGSYDVYLDVPSGFKATTPDRYIGLPVDSSTVMGIDFGLVSSAAPAAAAVTGTVTTTVSITSTSAVTGTTPALPSTGVQLQPRGRGLMGLAVAIGVLGALGLALEARLGRRSTHPQEGGEDA